jgi:molybdopterin molybdotransferase
MINYHQAKSILKKAKIKISNEKVLVKNSINRVAAKDILSPSNHPLGDNAAFDGFAINATDTKNISKKNQNNLKLLDPLQQAIGLYQKKLKNLKQLKS